VQSAQDGKEFQEGQRDELLANKKLLDSEQADLSSSIRSVHQDLNMAEDQVKGLEVCCFEFHTRAMLMVPREIKIPLSVDDSRP